VLHNAQVDVPYIKDIVAHGLAAVAGRFAPMVSTSCVCVDLQAGVGANNVVPPSASAKFNFRLLPGVGNGMDLSAASFACR
jgi:acetylornithine deacetylase/succinyl-diaminopimelate desuccinylase-like protein